MPSDGVIGKNDVISVGILFFGNFFERRRRARIDAENGHRRFTRPRLRIINRETRRYPTGYLRASSDTIEYDRGQHEPKRAREEHGAIVGSLSFKVVFGVAVFELP